LECLVVPPVREEAELDAGVSDILNGLSARVDKLLQDHGDLADLKHTLELQATMAGQLKQLRLLKGNVAAAQAELAAGEADLARSQSKLQDARDATAREGAKLEQMKAEAHALLAK
jgi:hypothetical protein